MIKAMLFVEENRSKEKRQRMKCRPLIYAVHSFFPSLYFHAEMILELGPKWFARIRTQNSIMMTAFFDN